MINYISHHPKLYVRDSFEINDNGEINVFNKNMFEKIVTDIRLDENKNFQLNKIIYIPELKRLYAFLVNEHEKHWEGTMYISKEGIVGVGELIICFIDITDGKMVYNGKWQQVKFKNDDFEDKGFIAAYNSDDGITPSDVFRIPWEFVAITNRPGLALGVKWYTGYSRFVYLMDFKREMIWCHDKMLACFQSMGINQWFRLCYDDKNKIVHIFVAKWNQHKVAKLKDLIPSGYYAEGVVNGYLRIESTKLGFKIAIDLIQLILSYYL